jgi:four helix bundle protein
LPVRHFSDLIAWQKAMDLVTEIYRRTQVFPGHENYGLTGQMRRAAVSIPSNIAEGQGRGSTKEFIHFLRIAKGSLQELQTQVLIAQRLCYFGSEDVDFLMDLSSEIARILNGLIGSLTTDH